MPTKGKYHWFENSEMQMLQFKVCNIITLSHKDIQKVRVCSSQVRHFMGFDFNNPESERYMNLKQTVWEFIHKNKISKTTIHNKIYFPQIDGVHWVSEPEII